MPLDPGEYELLPVDTPLGILENFTVAQLREGPLRRAPVGHNTTKNSVLTEERKLRWLAATLRSDRSETEVNTEQFSEQQEVLLRPAMLTPEQVSLRRKWQLQDVKSIS